MSNRAAIARRELAAVRAKRTLDVALETLGYHSAARLQAFLLVAMHEDKSLEEIAVLLDAPVSTTSRILLDFGEWKRNGEPGHGLIEQRLDPIRLRRNCYSLSPKGKVFYDRLVAAMES